ncbi:hypothetical protein DLM76_02885 [Leptospira yasudae]|nr:hypothetical protein DLM76_02885 [Leptospira yasudae]
MFRPFEKNVGTPAFPKILIRTSDPFLPLRMEPHRKTGKSFPKLNLLRKTKDQKTGCTSDRRSRYWNQEEISTQKLR